jgi:hypothetical protein
LHKRNDDLETEESAAAGLIAQPPENSILSESCRFHAERRRATNRPKQDV